MHDCIRFCLAQRIGDFFPISQIGFDKGGALIDGATMSFAQIIENENFVAFIDQELGANAADITRAADDENLHAPDNGLFNRRMSKSSQQLLGGLSPRFLLQRQDHAFANAIM
jgi:hypothetical protein